MEKKMVSIYVYYIDIYIYIYKYCWVLAGLNEFSMTIHSETPDKSE